MYDEALFRRQLLKIFLKENFPLKKEARPDSENKSFGSGIYNHLSFFSTSSLDIVVATLAFHIGHNHLTLKHCSNLGCFTLKYCYDLALQLLENIFQIYF